MAFGLGKLALSIAQIPEIPEEILEALDEADANDVLKRLVQDACSGVDLGLFVEQIPVRLFGRRILTLGPFRMRLTGWDRPPKGEEEANQKSATDLDFSQTPIGTSK